MTTAVPPVINRVPAIAAPVRNAGKALVATLAVLCLLVVAGALVGAWLMRRAVSPSQAVRQPGQLAGSPAPSRSPQFPSAPLILGRTAQPTSKASPRQAKAQPSVAVVSNVPPRAARTIPPPPPLGPSKKSINKNTTDFFVAVEPNEHLPTAKSARRAPVRDNSEAMPPEVRRLMQQFIQSGVPTKSANGKGTTIYVTRP